VVLQPGARWLTKRWPIEYYSELLRELLAGRSDLRVAVLGGPDDWELGRRLAQTGGERCLDLTGKTSLPEMVEWIRSCELMVTNDTGPMHIAAALGKPLVAIFGPTEPRRTGPYRHLDQVLQLELPCSPCFRGHCRRRVEMECLRSLSPSEVLKAVQARLSPGTLKPEFELKRDGAAGKAFAACQSPPTV
jgi:lipopolysaccharide heptosyltransferase II